MVHFGIICPSSTGHLNTMLPLGQELQQRGHRITLFGLLDAEPKTLVAGLEFWAIGETEFPSGATAKLLAQQGQLSGLAAERYTFNLFMQLAVVMLRDAPASIQAAGVEALLVDQCLLEGGTIADFLAIPFVTICSAMLSNQESNVSHGIIKPLTDLIAQYRQEWKLPLYSHLNDAFSGLAQLSQAPPEFEFTGGQQLPQWFHFTGPYHSSSGRQPVPFPYEKLTGKPLIYASMGTVQNRLINVFQIIASACGSLDAQLVISLGGSAKPESLPELQGNPIVVEYAPQLELLEKATMMITHAGMNTTMECLKNGVPIVAIPIANDQLGVAARITWTEVGEVVPLTKLNVERLQEAIKRVLTQEVYKKNALRLQAAIERAGGVSRAVDIIEQAVSTGKPVLAQK
ncbi:glycosyltransferase [Nostoc sp.]|uniref:glycosyltransferase n=1 Tax=Nostoc sp. TaxID=1180 RepID=UPI002FF989FF